MIDRVRRWLRGSSLDPIGPPIAAVTLPSGDVLVFDRAGHVLQQAGGPPGSVKGSVARDVGTAGRFFRIIGEATADGWVGWQTFEEASDRLHWEHHIEVEFTAIECTVEAWLTGGQEGQPAGRASYVVDRRSPLVLSPKEVWGLVGDAALRAAR